MEKKRILGNILFWTTLISPIVSFSLASMIGEADIFGVAGIIRYSWIMLIFLPIGILSILIGFKLKNITQKYKKNFIVSFICLPLLIVFGSYRLIFDSVISYDVNEISIIEDKINFEIPDEIKIATNKLDLYNISYIKITNSKSKDMFEHEIRNNQLWQEELNFKIKSMLPLDVQYESEVFEYFLFYSITDDEYNNYSSNDEYEYIFIAYDLDLQRLIILSNYQNKTN